MDESSPLHEGRERAVIPMFRWSEHTQKQHTNTFFSLAKQTQTSTRHTHTAITRKIATSPTSMPLCPTTPYCTTGLNEMPRMVGDSAPAIAYSTAPVGNGKQGQGLRGPLRSIECRLRPSPNHKVDFLDATAEAHAPTSNPMAVRPTPKSGWIQLPKAAHHAMSNLAVTGLEEAAMHRVYSFGSTNVDG